MVKEPRRPTKDEGKLHEKRRISVSISTIKRFRGTVEKKDRSLLIKRAVRNRRRRFRRLFAAKQRGGGPRELGEGPQIRRRHAQASTTRRREGVGNAGRLYEGFEARNR